MKCFLCGIFCLCLIIVMGYATSPPQPESVRFQITADWDLQHPYSQAVPGKYSILELVPKGQTIDNWTELLTKQNFDKKSLDPSPEDFMSKLKALRQQRCKNVVWKVLQKTSSSILYEWRMANCPPHPDQHEIARIIDGKWNRFRIAYTAKVKEISPDERKKWIDIFSAAEVVNGKK